MKIRFGFVSNSSSLSFIVKVADLSEAERKKINSYYEHVENSFRQTGHYLDCWSIYASGEMIDGWTPMDNGDLMEYLGGELTAKLKFDDLNGYEE
jgi:hypothetical protein